MVAKGTSTFHKVYAVTSLVLMVLSLPALLLVSFFVAFAENFSPNESSFARLKFLFPLALFFLELVLLIPYIRQLRSERKKTSSFQTEHFVQTPGDAWKKILSVLRIILFILNVGCIIFASVIIFDGIMYRRDRQSNGVSHIYNDPSYLLARAKAKKHWLEEEGISSQYTDITDPMDVGRRYLITLGSSEPVYQLFIMTPNFVPAAVNEDVPTSFTSKDLTLLKEISRISEQFPQLEAHQKNNILFSQRTEVGRMYVYWVARYSESDTSNLFVQAIARDGRGVGMLLHVDVSDSEYVDNARQAIEDVKNNPTIQKILVAISK